MRLYEAEDLHATGIETPSSDDLINNDGRYVVMFSRPFNQWEKGVLRNRSGDIISWGSQQIVVEDSKISDGDDLVTYIQDFISKLKSDAATLQSELGSKARRLEDVADAARSALGIFD